MKILLAPSESKRAGGENAFHLEQLLFEDLLSSRTQLLHHYSNLLQQRDLSKLSKMFGLKKEADITYHIKELIHEPTMKAVARYSGVAFEYLDYPSLSLSAQTYIDTHLLIFSNLFGIVRANDHIPEYRLQQGKAIGEIKPAQFYKPLLQPRLDHYLEGEEILDLRAGFYDKYYKPSLPYTTLKFIKEGRVVSHWAKAYRGIVLRAIAKAEVTRLEAFMRLPIEGLTLYEIQTKKQHTEIIYTITA